MPDTHGGNIFKFSHDHKINLSEVTDFSANINLLGPSPKGLEALTNGCDIYLIIQMLQMMML